MKRAIAAAVAVLVLSLTGYAALKVFAVTPSPVSILAPLNPEASQAAAATGARRSAPATDACAHHCGGARL